MRIDMLAQQDLGEIIIPLIVFAIYGISYVIKNLGEKKPAAPRRPAPPPPPRRVPAPAAEQQQMLRDVAEVAPKATRPAELPPQQREMEKLLEDLGLRKPAPGAAPARPAPPPLPRRTKLAHPPKPAAEIPKKQAKPTPLSEQREFHSRLENRHAPTVHSGIENKHLTANVSSVAPTAGPDAGAPTPRLRKVGDFGLRSLIHNSDELRRAYMLSIVFGPPQALRDEPRI